MPVHDDLGIKTLIGGIMRPEASSAMMGASQSCLVSRRCRLLHRNRSLN